MLSRLFPGASDEVLRILDAALEGRELAYRPADGRRAAAVMRASFFGPVRGPS